jgi:hypothetical protein
MSDAMSDPMSDAELRARYQAVVNARPETDRGNCPPPERLQDLVERTGEESARLEVLDHVMTCPSCHRDLALLQSIHVAQPRQRALMPRQWLAAAGMLLFVGGAVLVTRAFGPGSAGDLTRGDETVGGRDGAIAIVAPRDTVPAAGLNTLVWHAVPGAMRYAVEVLDQNDRVVFARQTSDTVAHVPALTASAAAWWVRATLGDGSERRSAIVRLRSSGP